MMRFLAGAALLAALAGCGGRSDHAALVEACAADGSTTESCECMATAAEDQLSPKLYGILVDAARSGEDPDDDVLAELTPAEQGQFLTFAMSAAVTCGMS